MKGSLTIRMSCCSMLAQLLYACMHAPGCFTSASLPSPQLLTMHEQVFTCNVSKNAPIANHRCVTTYITTA